MARAAVLCVGDEVLRGEVVNTNAAAVARALSSAGHRVMRQSVVGDDAADIADELALARTRADLLVISGGLGPTHDDVTLDAVAAALGLPLDVDPRVEAWVEAACMRLGRGTPDARRRMARVPSGADALENVVGVAPAVRISSGSLTIVLLPGVPSELARFLEMLFPPAERPAEAVAERVLTTPDESEAAEAVAAAERESGARIGIYPSEGEVRVRVRGEPGKVDAALAMLEGEGLLAGAGRSTGGRATISRRRGPKER